MNSIVARAIQPDGGPSGRGYIVRPLLRDGRTDGHRTPEAALAEAKGLAEAIGLTVTGQETIRVDDPKAGTLLGRGTVDRLGRMVREAAARGEPIDVMLIDHGLSPVQQRNLERALGTKVIDRTALILEIFGERARTREGQLQVELASLGYQRSRLVRSWTHLGRQRGGYGFLGGPGETQLEADRRVISGRISRLRGELEEVRRTRGLHRTARRRGGNPVIALVGYTNAGKSTLFNRLSGAGVEAADMLFATLDPTMRGIELPSGRRVVLSDTVGFISGLPHGLVEAFRATLEEVQAADLILHVRDIAHPDTEEQRADVEATLRALGIDADADPRVIEVANKMDLLAAEDGTSVRNKALRSDRFVAISARSGEGIPDLLETIDRQIRSARTLAELDIDLSDGAALAAVYDRTEVISRDDRDGHAHLRVAADRSTLARLVESDSVALISPRDGIHH